MAGASPPISLFNPHHPPPPPPPCLSLSLRFQLWSNCNHNIPSSSSSAYATGGGRGGNEDSTYRASSDFLRKPALSPVVIESVRKEILHRKEKNEFDDDDDDDEEGWVDWEDQILENTAPLVGFVRMVLHSGIYESGDRLSEEHEKTILERLLPYHPECGKKIGPGIEYITVGYHPNFESSRCLFLVRKDGDIVDFSYWKCIKGLIRKEYPLYAESFILKHFRHSNRQQK